MIEYGEREEGLGTRLVLSDRIWREREREEGLGTRLVLSDRIWREREEGLGTRLV